MTAHPICLVVLGMHRSGTSMLARILHLLGHAMPGDLFGATPSNPLGHWEPNPLISLNEWAFAEAGSGWDDLRPLAGRLPDEAEYRRRLGVWLSAELAGRESLVVKDPRLCLLAEPALSAMGQVADLRVLLPLRHPLDVAASLTARIGMPTGAGVALWLRHILEAERASRGHLRSFLHYDALMADWQAEMARVGADLGLPWNLPAAAPRVADFITPGLRHHHHPDPARLAEALAPDLPLAALAALDRLTTAPGDPVAMAALDEVRAQLDAALSLIGPMLGWHAIRHHRAADRERRLRQRLRAARRG